MKYNKKTGEQKKIKQKS